MTPVRAADQRTPRRTLEDCGDWLTLADLAALLGLSVRTLQRVRRHTPELLPPEFRPLSRTARYTQEAVRVWRDSGPDVVSLVRGRRAS